MYNIPCDFNKARPYIHNREEYLERYMTSGKSYSMVKGISLRLISIQGVYVDINHLTDIVPRKYRGVVDRYISEIATTPDNRNKEIINFYWRGEW